MSLGGYKFAGRYCQKGSLTDAQWALKMHKTKVAAFMAANALSGAGWDYDMTGSPDGNYHCLDSVGNNYVTVFKRTNGENDYTWFALYTLTKFTETGTDTGSVQVGLVNNKITSSNAYVGGSACNFYRIGMSGIAYNDNLTSVQNNTTGLLVPGNTATTSSSIGSNYYPLTAANTALGSSSVYFGFAVKADNVILLQACTSLSKLAVSVASGHAFSSLVNSNDTKELLAYNLQQQGTSYENADRSISSLSSRLCVCLTHNGEAVYRGCVMVGGQHLAFCSGTTQQYGFESIAITNIQNSASSVYGKGLLAIDLIAANILDTNPDIFTTLGNGKYLLVLKYTGGSKTADNGEPMIGTSNGQFLWVGWDPSNPDITQSSSWTEYTD